MKSFRVKGYFPSNEGCSQNVQMILVVTIIIHDLAVASLVFGRI